MLVLLTEVKLPELSIVIVQTYFVDAKFDTFIVNWSSKNKIND